VCLGAAWLTSSLLPAQVKSQASSVDARIQHIENSIVPGTMVRGEPVQTKMLIVLMKEMRVPGVSIAVIHNGQIEWARGFGVTSIGGPATTPETIFQAGSLSKPLTALAVLHLVQSGKLNLDTDVNQYLKTWKVPENEFTAKNKVTLRRLLSHTAGINAQGFPGYAVGEKVPTLMQVLNGEKPAITSAIHVENVPGTNWKYSNGGYVIVQKVLEDVTGKPFAKLMQELVLSPIGMAHSTFEQPLSAARMVEAATPYGGDGQPIAGGPHTYPELAPSGLWTTASDLARYVIEVQNALTGKSNRVISAATAREMLAAGMNHWGLGPSVGGSDGHMYFTHGGDTPGFQCRLVAYEGGDGAVIMTNSVRGTPLAQEVLRTIAYEYKWPDFRPIERTIVKIDPKIFDQYVGAYLIGRQYMTVTRDGEHFFAHLTGQDPVEIFPQNDHEFFLKDVDAQLVFEKTADGKAEQVSLRQNANIQGVSAQLTEREGRLIKDAQAAAPVRFKAQMQDPRTEAVLRQLLEEIRRGDPNYDHVIPSLAGIMRETLPEVKAEIRKFGALKSLTFKGITPGGSDIYQVKFESGEMECRIMLASDGTIVLLGFS